MMAILKLPVGQVQKAQENVAIIEMKNTYCVTLRQLDEAEAPPPKLGTYLSHTALV